MVYRKAREDNEILTFNNQRLTKRITKLQEDLSVRLAPDTPCRLVTSSKERGRGEGSSWFSSGAKGELSKVKQSLEVTRQELQTKIEENERVHIRLFEERQETKAVRSQLEAKLAEVELLFASSQRRLDQIEATHLSTLQEIQKDLEKKELSVSDLQEQLNAAQRRHEAQREENMEVRQALQGRLMEASNIIQRQVVLDDTRNALLNRWNLPSQGFRLKHQTEEAREAGISTWTDLLGAMGDYYRERAKREACIIRSGSLDDAKDLKVIHRSLETALRTIPPILEGISLATRQLHEEYQSELGEFSEEASKQLLLKLEELVLADHNICELQRNCVEFPHRQVVPQLQEHAHEHASLCGAWEDLKGAVEALLSPISVCEQLSPSEWGQRISSLKKSLQVITTHWQSKST